MIKKNLAQIITLIILFIAILIGYQKYQQTQKILHDTSSAKTQRIEISKEATFETNQKAPQKYVIKKGDTLWDLSVKFYGDGTKYHEIIRNNPGKTFKFKNGNEGLIYPGTELEIPPLVLK